MKLVKSEAKLFIWLSGQVVSQFASIFSFFFISAKLSSCLDQLHSILGENLHEPTAISAVMQCNYDVERALDQIFSQGSIILLLNYYNYYCYYYYYYYYCHFTSFS